MTKEKLTIDKANEIFRTKYPNGELGAIGTNRFWVTFNSDIKRAEFKEFVHYKRKVKLTYYEARTYDELLRRFGFRV